MLISRYGPRNASRVSWLATGTATRAKMSRRG